MGSRLLDLRAMRVAVRAVFTFGSTMLSQSSFNESSPPFHDARTQAELTKLIREGRIPGLPSVYSDSLRRVVTSMLRQDVSIRLDAIGGKSESADSSLTVHAAQSEAIHRTAETARASQDADRRA